MLILLTRIKKFHIVLVYLSLFVVGIIIIQPWNKYTAWEYGRIAANIVLGKGIVFFEPEGTPVPSAFMPPAYWALIAVFFYIFGVYTKLAYFALNLLHAIFGIWGILLTHKLSIRMFSNRVYANATALTLAIFPQYVFFSIAYHPVALTTPLLVLLALLGIDFIEQPSNWVAFKIGIVWGIYWYFRAEAIIFIGLYLIVLVFLSINKKDAIKKALLVVCVSVLLVFPYILRNSLLFGEFYPTVSVNGGQNIYRVYSVHATGSAYAYIDDNKNLVKHWNYSSLQKEISKLKPSRRFEIERDKIFWRKTIEELKNSTLLRQIMLLSKRFLFFFFFDPYHPKDSHLLAIVSWFLLLGLSIRGIFLARPLPHQTLILFAPVIAQLLIIIFLSVPLPRFRLQFAPYLAVFAGITITHLANRNQRDKIVR